MTRPYGPEPHDQDAHLAGLPAPHTKPMTAADAMARMVERKGIDAWATRTIDPIVQASHALRAVELEGHWDDAQWWVAMRAGVT